MIYVINQQSYNFSSQLYPLRTPLFLHDRYYMLLPLLPTNYHHNSQLSGQGHGLLLFNQSQLALFSFVLGTRLAFDNQTNQDWDNKSGSFIISSSRFGSILSFILIPFKSYRILINLRFKVLIMIFIIKINTMFFPSLPLHAILKWFNQKLSFDGSKSIHFFKLLFHRFVDFYNF